jgi:hypothetical protein
MDTKLLEGPSANGHGANGNSNGVAEKAADHPAAAELPQAGEIPEKRRRPRLLDRITGVAKS